MKVKIVEQVYALNKENKIYYLINKDSLRKHKSQDIILFLIMKGINSSILLALRDARFWNYSASVMGIMESSLHNGPINCDCYPDFTLSLSDPHILKALTLNIQTAGELLIC